MPLGTEVGLPLGNVVLDGDPTPPVSPTFWPISSVAKRSPISATAELLFCIIFDKLYLSTSGS